MLQINASITTHQKNIWCAYRTKHLRHYDSEYFLTELDSEFEPVSNKRLLAENKNTAFEDIRLFSFGEKLLAFYNYLPFIKNVGWSKNSQTGYGEVDTEKGIIKNQIELSNRSTQITECDWVPFEYNNDLYLLTELEPFLQIKKIDAQNCLENIYKASEQTQGWEYGEFKGGTPLFAEPNTPDGWYYGFIYSFREGEQGFEKKYYYTIARFNFLDKRFQFHPSPLPYIEDEEDTGAYNKLWERSNGKRFKVIFPIGIMHHEDGVIVSFGKDEVSSYTEHFTWDRIKNYFNK